jgi:Leucine-rich repeat (LRR) protein
MISLVSILMSGTFSTISTPIEFIFRDALPPEYYGQNDYYLNVDELRQKKLVCIHHDMNPNNFEYIESYLDREKRREAECLSKGVEYTRDPIVLDMIDDNNMFRQLNEFWKQEEPGVSDIDANKFFLFLYAAGFLEVREDACRRFTRNMARILLRGTHSHDIQGCMNQQLKGSKICWSLFLACAAELGSEVQTSDQAVILCSTGSRCGTILETKPETTMNELRILPDVFDRSKNAGTHIAHFLVWFLWHLDLHEFDLSGCTMDKDDVDAFGHAFSEAEGLTLRAMDIFECHAAPGTIAIILPHLKDLTKLNASGNSLSEKDRDALAACTSLTELNIGYCFKRSPGCLAIILPRLENLTKLYAYGNSLNEKDCDALAASTLLTELNIRHCFEDSPGCLTIILPRLENLTKLDVSGNSLNEKDCDALSASTLLTELNVNSCFENSSGYLARILPRLENLTKLDVSGNRLNEEDCGAFVACTLLTELNISSCFENSSGCLAIILSHLKGLTKLYTYGNDFNEVDRDALAACTLLTELDIGRCFERSPGYLAIILPCLKDLIKLYASGNDFNEADCRAIAGHTLLTELRVRYCSWGYPNAQIYRILPRLENLIKLDVSGNRLNEEDCGALAASTSLTELNVSGCFENSPGYLAIILSRLKDLTKLYTYGNDFNEADIEAIEAAREHGVEISY